MVLFSMRFHALLSRNLRVSRARICEPIGRRWYLSKVVNWVPGSKEEEIKRECLRKDWVEENKKLSSDLIQYYTNELWYWENRDMIMAEYSVNTYIAVANNEIISHSRNRTQVLGDAMEKGHPFFIARVGFESVTYVVAFGDVISPHPLEWAPHPKGTFKRLYRIARTSDANFRPFVTIPIILNDNDADPDEYPVTFLIDTGAKVNIIAFDTISKVRGGYGSLQVYHEHDGIAHRMELVDLGVKAASRNVNVLSYDALHKFNILDEYSEIQRENKQKFGMDEAKYPITEQCTITDTTYDEVMMFVVERINTLIRSKKLKAS